MNILTRYIQRAGFGSLILVALACRSEPAEAHAEPASKEPAVAADGQSEVNTQKRQALQAYEGMRATLAGDDIVGIAPHAAVLNEAATSVAAKGVEGWGAIAKAAKTLKAMPTEDATKVRIAFGELSKHLIGAISQDSSLAAGFHVFECPMAPGYKKWFQPTAKLENPYMGKRMLRCGAESDWKS